MNIPVILVGIMIAAMVFSALMWSVYRSFTAKGRMRMTAILLALSTLAGMATISLNAPNLAVFAGGACLGFGAVGIWTESRWSKLLPFSQTLFGLALIARLPWGGA